jgi:hypothetical protein
MKKLLLLCMSVLLFTVTGCATKKFVLEQTDPLNKKIGDLDSRISALEYKLSHMPPAELAPADKELLQKAVTAGQNAEAAAQKAQDSANTAAESARKAEEAANAAQTATKKGAKILELEQKK